MAKSFMIRFLHEGKPWYANVYVYDSPKEYHVRLVNSVVHDNLPDSMVLIEQNEKLCLQQQDHIPAELVDTIGKSIEEHQGR